MNDLVESLAREIASLRDEVRDLRWRQKNMIRPMVASEVDNRRGLVRADAGGFQTPWMQAFHQGGAVRSFSPIAAAVSFPCILSSMRMRSDELRGDQSVFSKLSLDI